jgi:hypothetical protein
MIHPPTVFEGPLQLREVNELAELFEDLENFITTAEHVPEHLRLRVGWWALRLENTGAR